MERVLLSEKEVFQTECRGFISINPLNYYEKTFELKPWQANLLKVVFIVLVVVLVVFLIFKG